MVSDKLRLVAHIFTFIVPYAFTLIRQRISAIIHRQTYKVLPNSQIKTVVVIGGSFAGFQLVKRLTETLPTGYRVVLVERNSHLNYLFAFPRFSVLKGHEQYAFIPYTGLAKTAPEGIFCHVQDTATEITDKHVVLERGEKMEYDYLVIATGTSSALPSKVTSTEREGGEKELRGMQEKIADAKRIAVVGGGAVGVELASDIKSFYPEKDVALIHSRGQLLHSFGKRLHDHAISVFEELGVAVLLNERPKIPVDGNTLELLHGKEELFDLIIPCTGQRPNSAIVSAISPAAVSKTNSQILVKSTLQLADDSHPRIFSFGDVADTGGPKMARASYFQSEIVCQNILLLIKGKKDLKTYKPNIFFEGSIKLTLGKTRLVMYMKQNNGRELIIPANKGQIDLGVKSQWGFFGANVREIESESRDKAVAASC
ncbi:FAD/NAD(P)-binding domain-containing protein [Melanomma pulvis-pyrius CBS 109.77]|uniref:FAD/NAD(P)-binding domain-containing protein n=1 Tax=Melanomma pulvis-pyrius CBS 109.77 TaxID=1314802 RepID=A0A6A6XDI9_9PLEO|nr:FAD/NAD(P)-binding domain-containing protein [Melanomma pulvis-pyrius CBS 109.77]